jgi:hypothetical protein
MWNRRLPLLISTAAQGSLGTGGLMARLGKSGTLGLLLVSSGLFALAAGLAQTAGVAAQTPQSTEPPVPRVPVYVSDFELPAVAPAPSRNSAPAAGTDANPSDKATPEPDTPGAQARLLTDSFAKTLVETLQKKGFAATRIKEKPPGPGVLLRGVFAEADAKNQIRREILGAGSANPQFFLYVGTFNLKSPDQPLYQVAPVQSPDPRYGPVIMPNAYIPMDKFQIAKRPTQADVQRVCTQIAENLNKLLQSNKEAFAY